jgi:hypothetical protein
MLTPLSEAQNSSSEIVSQPNYRPILSNNWKLARKYTLSLNSLSFLSALRLSGIKGLQQLKPFSESLSLVKCKTIPRPTEELAFFFS